MIVHRSTEAMDFAQRAGRAFLATMLALAFIIASGAGCLGFGRAAAQSTAWIQFGPVGNGPGTTNTYDPDFVREWEANPPKGYATLSKANIAATKNAIQRYTNIVAQGGWPQLPEPPNKTPRDSLLQYGITDPAVGLLRKRLAASGDLSDSDTSSTYFDMSVDKALKRFQASNGLTPTGIADKRTIVALNVPADARLKQLKANVSRLGEFVPKAGKKYVVVNIPAAQVEAVQNGQIVARYAAVVGKADRPTPLLHTPITDLSFNPVWRLPPTVISEDLIPRGREMQAKGQNVLLKFGIDAYSNGKKVDPTKINWDNVKPGTYTYSQQPGKENPLGFLKINFDSAHSVYMHDTPSDRIFGRNFRSASSGCIRVHNIENLAAWLLADQRGWDAERIASMKTTGERLDLRLKRPVQLLFVYISAWATPDGVIQFRRDIYQKDGIGEIASNY
ncbi:ErfK/YbiS/YcfS/YnhG family protein [Hyphomicrobium denitrificans 1NES1]|uniref:ErfK/YbiS/YcfS/YnhG family protein n=1 Tax=Hyphomicrobium denitrificans 1NES1 TaxID=670307 RepID=N0B7N4_9HYPH|nr:ErfK/YbiS/YcfS/YnhG family protein [Hyphomicrobium denitrificans 1NES1]